MRKIIGNFIVGVALLALSAPAWALSIAVDVDPSMAGVQSTRTVTQGEVFFVDIVLESYGNEQVQGFAFDLDFNDAILTANSVADGGFLSSAPFPFGFGTFNFLNDVSGSDVNFAMVALGLAVNDGNLPLATIQFTGLAEGMTSLDLVENPFFPFLSTPFGNALPLDAVSDGSITVVGNGPNPVPEPGTMVLLGTGLAGLAAWRVRRTHAS